MANKDEFIKFRITADNKAFLESEAKRRYTTMSRLFDRWLDGMKRERAEEEED